MKLPHLFDTMPIAVMESVRRQRAALTKPVRSVEEHMETLERCGVPRFADRLRTFTADL